VVVVEVKVVANLEIKIMDSSSQMTHIIIDSNNHTRRWWKRPVSRQGEPKRLVSRQGGAKEASLKAGGAKEDMALGIDSSQEQILETVIIVANQANGPKNAERSKAT